MTCSPSARAESSYSDTPTTFAQEGTIAHSCAEFMLNYYKTAGELLEFEALREEMLQTQPEEILQLIKESRALDIDFWDMAQTVHDFYVTPVFEDFIQARAEDPDAQLLIESPLSLSSFIPEGFGTSDAVIMHGDILDVYDLKYGKGVRVDADHNPQMMCYALGALYGDAELYLINTVRMHILQPRLRHFSTFTTSFDALVSWGQNILRPAAEKAFRGEGNYTPGDHCKFCKAAPRCRTLYVYSLAAWQSMSQPETLSNEELGEALKMTETVKTWAARVEEYAARQLTEGVKLPGWKLVEGRSVRKITDQEGALRELQAAGFEPEMVLKAPELKTVSDLEKMLGKKGKELLKPYISKPQGKPTLAPASDPRPELSNAERDFSGAL